MLSDCLRSWDSFSAFFLISPTRAMITALFQGFVRIKWHNPEKLTHVYRYNSIGNPNKVKVRLMVGHVGRVSHFQCHRSTWVRSVWRYDSLILEVAGQGWEVGVEVGPPGWGTPVDLPFPVTPAYGGHSTTLCMLWKRQAQQCSTSYFFKLKSFS